MKFGTGGWRAIIGDEFTKANIIKFAYRFANIIKEETSGNIKPVVIGYDNRFLSYEAQEWLMESLNALGINTLTFSESVPTPLVMYTVKNRGLDFGLMVTASHNPYNYNGIKVFVKGGLDAPKEFTDKFEASYIISDLHPISGNNSVITEDIEEYISELLSAVNTDEIKEYAKNIHIAFDGMHGSGSKIFLDLLSRLGISYTAYSTNVDAYFDTGVSKVPEPNEFNCSKFIEEFKRLKDNTSDHTLLGVVFDGDGDRLMLLDEHGQVIDMNTILCMLYWFYHTYKSLTGPVVKNLVTTNRLKRMADYYNEACYDVPVGFKWITSNMIKYDALLGGESSGGLSLRGHIYGKDSLLSTLLVIEMISYMKVPNPIEQFTSLLDDKFGKVYEYSTKLSYDPADKDTITQKMHEFQIDGMLKEDYDGIKFTDLKGNWISYRFSGTEPIIRIMAEADSEQNLEELLKHNRFFSQIS